VAIQPTPVGYFNLAGVYEKVGRLDDAVRTFRLYLADRRGEKDTNIQSARAELRRLEQRARGPRP